MLSDAMVVATIPVTDLDRSLEFYRDALGLQVLDEGPFAPKNNHIDLPAGPGLGVTLNQDKLRFAAKLLKDRGLPNKYFDPDAPGQMRRMPLV